jgi:hypothetical protein
VIHCLVGVADQFLSGPAIGRETGVTERGADHRLLSTDQKRFRQGGNNPLHGSLGQIRFGAAGLDDNELVATDAGHDI